jgi:tetratricopeptide (TPR) repeat protein
VPAFILRNNMVSSEEQRISWTPAGRPRAFSVALLCLFWLSVEPASSLLQPSQLKTSSSGRSLGLAKRHVVSDASSWSNAKPKSVERFQEEDINEKSTKNRVRKKYQRKRIPETERERKRLSQERQAKYEQIRSNADGECPSIWSFESLFPGAVWDKESVERDLYSVKRRDQSIQKERQPQQSKTTSKLKTSAIGGSSMMRVWREPKLSSFVMPYTDSVLEERRQTGSRNQYIEEDDMTEEEANDRLYEPSLPIGSSIDAADNTTAATFSERIAELGSNSSSGKINLELTRMVQDKIYGYRRGTNLYDTSLMGDGAVKFREGVRLGNALPVNAARLNYFAKKELRKDRVEEAQEMFEKAIEIDPRDGRAYLGLARCAERRRDFTLSRKILSIGIANCVSVGPNNVPDIGANPFLLQALGCLEEKAGNLARAEALFIEAAKSRPSHAAAWVALGQLRTVKFRQGAAAGRACFQAAERELQKVDMPPNAHVYTAWASMEYKKAGDVRRSRSLYRKALDADKRCSAAWLQLGVMEANCENWKEAELCFTTVLKFDQRNTRVLQAYALMESKRPDSESRKVIDLFERALKANPRDAGVLQPYALYVAQLGDIESAREL